MSPIQALRSVTGRFLDGFNGRGSNPGLRFDRMNARLDCDGEHQEKDNLIAMLTGFNMAKIDELRESYQYAFNRWREIQENRPNSMVFEITAQTKVLPGSGNTSVNEFGFSFCRPWGVPVIAGSTLKGLVSAYLEQHGGEQFWRSKKSAEKSELMVELFGGTVKDDPQQRVYSGSVVFNDARLILDNKARFKEDIINVHHQKYYSGNRLPDGTENPIPVKMAALDAGVRFLVVLEGPDDAVNFVREVLANALQSEGLGGKTAVGYGRFEIELSDEEKRKKFQKELQGAAPDELLKKIYAERDNPVLLPVVKEKLDELNVGDITDKNLKKDLEVLFRQLRPLKLLAEQIRSGTITDTKQLSNNQLGRPVLNAIANYEQQCKTPLNRDPDAQLLFNTVLEKLSPDTEFLENNSLMQKIVYGWEELGYNGDQLLEILADESHPWPPKDDTLREYIKTSSNIDDEEREILLEEL